MPSIINSDDGVVSGTSGLKTTGGNDGVLTFQRNGTEAMRIDSAGITKFRSTGSAYDSTPGDGISDGLYLQVDSSGIAHIDSYAGGGSTILAFGTNSGGGAVVERMRLDSSGNFAFNSGYGSVATAYGCRAWVAYDGTGTPSIREDGNVSSLSDLGVGQWLVNFTTSMPDANYCTVASCNEVDNATTCQARLPATSNIAIDVYTSPSGLSNSRADPSRVNVAIFR